MGKIFYLMGKSASGKDTIFKKIREVCPELDTIVLYTTRPMRDGETDGVEYHFTSEEQLKVFEDAGKPTLTTKLAKEFKTVAAKDATSANELVHVIVTYSANTALFAVYVNGERTGSKASGYVQYSSNIFAIGANYAEGAPEASASDLSVVGVKIYDAKFSQAQALVRYQNAVEEYKK